jgi:hypothetical protein
MAANDPRPVVTKAPQAGLPPASPSSASPVIKRPPLSAEDAERFASRIRPSWELFDDSSRNDLAGDLGLVPAPVVAKTTEPAVVPKPAEPAVAKPVVVPKPAEPAVAKSVVVPSPVVVPKPAAPAAAPAPDSAPDTIIDGVPTLAIGSGPLATPREPALVDRVAEPAPAKASPAPARLAKTQLGMGQIRPAKTIPDDPPVVVARPAPAVAAPAMAPKASPSRSGDVTDDLQIPVTGASGGQVVKIGAGLAAVLVAAGIGYAVLGGSGKKAATSTPAVAVVTAATAVPLPATVPPPPLEPAPVAAPPATAPVNASAEPKAVANAPELSPPTRALATPPAPEPKKALPADKPARPVTPHAPAPKSGGIIRDTPF